MLKANVAHPNHFKKLFAGQQLEDQDFERQQAPTWGAWQRGRCLHRQRRQHQLHRVHFEPGHGWLNPNTINELMFVFFLMICMPTD